MRGLVQKPMLGDECMSDGTNPGDRNNALRLLLNEGSGGQVFDLSGNGNIGTFVGDTHFVSGKFGSCLNFDGTGDYVNISGVASNVSVVVGSISVWVKFTDAADLSDSAIHNLVEIGDNSDNTQGIFLRKIAADTIVMRYRIGGNNYDAAISDISDFVNWHHLFGSWDAVNVYIYDNGVLIDTTNRTAGGNIASGELDQAFIATDAHGTPGTTFFKGLIDVPIIWDHIHTDNEITLLYREPFCDLGPRRFLPFAPAAAGAVMAGHYYRHLLQGAA